MLYNQSAIGSIAILPNEDFWLFRADILIAISVLIWFSVSYVMGMQSTQTINTNTNRDFYKLVNKLHIMVMGGLIIIAMTIIMKFVGPIGITLAVIIFISAIIKEMITERETIVDFAIFTILGIISIGAAVSTVMQKENMPDQNYYYALSLLYVIFPIINACCDTISTGFSRYFGEKLIENIKEKGKISTNLLYLFADIVTAGITLLLLASSIYGSIELLAYIDKEYFNIGITISAKELADSVVKDLFGKHIWITLMLFSTLIPTVIHLIIAVFVLVFGKINKWIINRINNHLYIEAALLIVAFRYIIPIATPIVFFIWLLN